MRVHATSSLLWLAVATCLGPALQASAQTPPALAPEQATSVFPPEYFAASAPANAYEMVQRLPGFVIVEADADVRGYAAAQGNVLIDGARPASKRDDIEDLLKRIPAQGVERIELVRSGAAGIDMAGHALLANIVRRRDASIEAAMEVGAAASTDGWIAPQAQWEYGRRWDDRALDLAIKLQPELDDDSGRGRIRTTDPDGVPLQAQQLHNRTTNDQGEASVSWRQPFAQGRLTLTAALRGEDVRSDTRITEAGDRTETINEREDLREADAGARYVRQLGTHSTLELMATQQLGWLESLEDSREDDDIETFRETTDTGETIGRIDLTHEWSPTLSLATSLEGAFNFLEGDAQLEENGVPVLLPGSNVRIEEQRIEAVLGATWKPAEDWVLETGLRVEDSSITQTGDSPLQRRFTYLKPRASLRWDADENNQLRLSVSREVGQLEFSDFVASASLDTGVVTAGNAALEPDKTLRMAAAWEYHFWTDAALTLSWTHDRISDVVDRVLIITPDDVFDAPGNIGDGRRDTLTLELSAPLDRFGFTGAQLRSSLLWRKSEVIDPVTGEQRGISEENPFEGSISLSQDLPALHVSWGIELDSIAERETNYSFDEVTRESEGMGWTLFVERRLNERWRVRAEATDLFGRDFVETREKYDGPRSNYPLQEIERRNRETPGYFSLVFRRSMGD